MTRKSIIEIAVIALLVGPSYAMQDFDGESKLARYGCSAAIIDSSNTGACVRASSVPQLGTLYPLGTELFIDAATGNVGVGTITPGQRLSVSGVIESTDGGFLFPDGTVQSTAQLQGPAGPTGPSGPAGPVGPAGPPGSLETPEPTQVIGTFRCNELECDPPTPIYSFGLDPVTGEVAFHRDFDDKAPNLLMAGAVMNSVDELVFDLGDGFVICCRDALLKDVSIETLDGSAPRMKIVVRARKLEWEQSTPTSQSAGDWDYAQGQGYSTENYGPSTDLSYAWFRNGPPPELPTDFEAVYDAEQTKTTPVGTVGSTTNHESNQHTFGFTIRKRFDTRSPALMFAMLQGQSLNSVRVNLVAGDLPDQPELSWVLDTVTVESIEIGLDSTTGEILEEISFAFGRIEWIYREGQPDEASVAWDLVHQQ